MTRNLRLTLFFVRTVSNGWRDYQKRTPAHPIVIRFRRGANSDSFGRVKGLGAFASQQPGGDAVDGSRQPAAGPADAGRGPAKTGPPAGPAHPVSHVYQVEIQGITNSLQ